MIRIGVLVLPTDPWHTTVTTVQHLENLGYDHLWTYDHLSWQRYRDHPWHATYPWLAGLAAQTHSIRLGTMVANPNIRHPLILAKDAMTLDHISGGRLTLGIGAGGTGFDANALGDPKLTPTERIQRLEEFVPLVDGLLRGTITDHNSERYFINEARLLPGCVQTPRVPIALAAGGARGLRLTAEIADAWITYGDTSFKDLSTAGTESIVEQQTKQLEHHCANIERDPDKIDRIYLIGNTEARPLTSIDAFRDFVGRYEELGFTDLVFHQPRPGDAVWHDDPEIVEAIADALLIPRVNRSSSPASSDRDTHDHEQKAPQETDSG